MFKLTGINCGLNFRTFGDISVPYIVLQVEGKNINGFASTELVEVKIPDYRWERAIEDIIKNTTGEEISVLLTVYPYINKSNRPDLSLTFVGIES